MRIFDLSFRFKIPLWGSALIAVTALILSLSFVAQSYDDLKRDMLGGSESLGRTLVRTLYTTLLHDDTWRAFEIVNAPYQGGVRHGNFQAEGLIVLNGLHQVFVSSQPDTWPLLANMKQLGPAYAALDQRIGGARANDSVTLEAGGKILLAIPLVADGIVLGHLVLVHPADFYWPRFRALILRALAITALVLAVLLPINWYWGRRMAIPLVQLSRRMDELGRRLPEPLSASAYAYRDELGHLFRTYDRMLAELVEKEGLEQQMVKADRLAALGRLTAGIAHEINNPLGGLLTALDTLKRHGRHDPVLDRVVPLLERGLNQIKDIVAALLVEARIQSRALTRQDVDDVHTLLAQEVKKRAVAWEWHNGLEGTAELPATLVRQVLINLLLNAVQAAGRNGRVSARILATPGGLRIEVGNDGRCIPPELMEHLFEPFTGRNEEGHGLGLWITYQIIQQLHGRIDVDSREGWTRFVVELPEGEAPCLSVESA